MGRRKFNQLQKKYPFITFTEVWPNSPGVGKWAKRQLSKARRRYIKQYLRCGRGKEPTHWESEINWRGW